jgi:hypothetical protein
MNGAKDLFQSRQLIMSSITFDFDIRAVSFQQGEYVKYLTPYQKAFKVEISKILHYQYTRQVKDFKASFDPKFNVIESSWLFLYTDFFTKKENTISSKCLDLDNSTKNIQDLIFRFMDMDDKNIAKSKLMKWQSDQDKIICRLNIVERKETSKEVEIFLSSLLP